MSFRVEKLQSENSKLRGEIRKLQAALKDMSSYPSLSPQSQSKVRRPSSSKPNPNIPQSQRRRQLMMEIGEKLDKGIFSPAKYKSTPRQKSLTSNKENITIQKLDDNIKIQPVSFIASFGQTAHPQINIVPDENRLGRSLISNNSISSTQSIQNQTLTESKAIKTETLSEVDNLELNLHHLDSKADVATETKPYSTHDIAIETIKRSPSPDFTSSLERRPDSNILSYQNSAQQTMQTPQSTDKGSMGFQWRDEPDHYEISFRPTIRIPQHTELQPYLTQPFDNHTQKSDSMAQDLETSLIHEIQALRQENRELRDLIVKTPRNKRKTTPRRKKRKTSQTRSRSTSRTPRAMQRSIVYSPLGEKNSHTRCISKSPARSRSGSISPIRTRHCGTCDHLLSKGYSTRYCSKHGNINYI